MKPAIFTEKNIAFFPGVFDTIYRDQIKALQQAKKQFGFDKIILINYNKHPHVDNKKLPPLQERFNYINSVIKPYSYLDQYSIDFKTNKKVHLYDLINYLKHTFQLSKVHILMGHDSIGHKFHKWEQIKEMADLYIMPVNRKINSSIKIVANYSTWIQILDQITQKFSNVLKPFQLNELIERQDKLPSQPSSSSNKQTLYKSSKASSIAKSARIIFSKNTLIT